jgi:Fe2+ or Zn2+ uptake regulation protein
VRYTGHKKIVALASYDLSDLVQRALSSLPIKDLHDVLSGNRLELIALLSYQKTAEELAFAMPSVNKKTIMNNLKFLLLRGIINQKTNGYTVYYVRPNTHILSDLARHIIQNAKETKVRKLFKNVLLIRVIEQDVLVKTTEFEEVEGYFPTCYNIFHKFGVNMLLKDEYFWVNRKPTLEDVIVQTLKLDRDSTRGTIYVSALIYKNWSQLSLKKLRRLAQRYRVDKWVDRLLGFVKTKGAKGKRLTQPEWSEVEHVLGV